MDEAYENLQNEKMQEKKIARLQNAMMVGLGVGVAGTVGVGALAATGGLTAAAASTEAVMGTITGVVTTAAQAALKLPLNRFL